jgi:hypothetical protein
MNRNSDYKKNFILNALEKGFTIRKVPELHDSYEFKLILDKEIIRENNKKSPKRTLSEPINRKIGLVKIIDD